MLFQYDAKLLGEYDVVVAGGGPAGFGAGIAAARGGLKTLLIEATGCIGGVSTSGNLPFYLGAYNGSIPYPQMIAQGLKYEDLPRPRRAVRGIFDLFINEVKNELHGGCGPVDIPQTDKYPGLSRLSCHDEFTFDIEVGKRVYDQMAMKYGLNLQYYTQVIQADMEDNKVKGIYVMCKEGICYIKCKAIIDCTGDADVVARAGYETYKGDKETGEMCGVGFVAHMENVDPAPLEQYLNEGNDPWFTERAGGLIIFPMVQDGVFMINGGTSRKSIDGTSIKDLTEMALWGRQNAKYLEQEVFRKHMPGGENARLRSTATTPGVRETRRIVAEYILTEEDLLNGVNFEDTIALAGRHFDLGRGNGALKKGKTCAERGQGFANSHRVMLGVSPIPYRCLIPKGSDDIIVAGRCIAADGQALGPARIMSTCMAVGEAAGTAAILKLRDNISFRDVNYRELRDLLRANGAEVDA